MILAFHLSMPNCASWDGKWSGEGRRYVIVRTFLGKQGNSKAEKIRDTRYYHYSWPDGWAAGITVRQVDSLQAAKLRRESEGFCGYEWMVATICEYGQPLASHEIPEFVRRNEIVNAHD